MSLKILLFLFLPAIAILFVITNLPKNNQLDLSFEKVKETIEFKPIPPSVKDIFTKDHNWVATLSAERKRVLIATGDVIPARSVNYQTVTRNNFIWPYEKIAEYLKSADVTFVNLETPLINNCPLTQEGMIFCGSSKNIEGLVYSGVDIVSLANNHAANHGEKGVLET